MITTILLVLFAAAGCSQKKHAESPAGYDLANPLVYKLPPVLDEVSGIAFKNGNADTIYAEQDEEGRLFYFHLGDENVQHTKFSKRGDFEDVAISHGYVIMLRSDGTLFTFPSDEVYNKETGNINEQQLLPKGEYEAIFADEGSNEIYVLCKSCSTDKGNQSVSGQVFRLENDGKLALIKTFAVDTKSIAALTGEKKINLKPSALGKNPLTGEWYILSSVNKLLVVADAQWKPTATFNLNPAVFTQPEGIAFDSKGNLYIANEMGTGTSGTVLQFQYSKK